MFDIINKFFFNLKKHIGKVLLFFFSLIFFALLIFPYDDLTDLVTSQVSKATQNQLFVSFQGLDLNLLPIGINMQDVELVTNTFPTLNAQSLTFSPSIADLLAFKFGASISAKKLLGADIFLDFSLDKPNPNEEVETTHKVSELEIRGLNLKEFSELMPNLPVALHGLLNANVFDVNINPSMQEQPSGEFELSSDNVILPPSNIPTPIGSLALPEITFSRLQAKGRIINGDFIVEQLDLGSEKDEMQVQLKGQLNVLFRRFGQVVKPAWREYNIRTKLTVSDRLKKEIYLMSLLKNYESSSSQKNVSVYELQLSGAGFNTPPKMTKATFN